MTSYKMSVDYMYIYEIHSKINISLHQEHKDDVTLVATEKTMTRIYRCFKLVLWMGSNVSLI